ncbi:MAG: response regulator [Termitinemataceae bacterium]
MKTILVIDDDINIQAVISAVLQKQGHRVFKALNTMEAEQVLTSQTIDLILLDIVLPGQGGLEYLMDLHNQYPSIAVIVMSGKIRTDLIPIKKLAQQFGALCILPKPFSAQELIESVSDALNASCT